MTQPSKNNEFNASDIERYHAGQMSAQERHALEKAALDDPFLADALEGYAYTATAADDLQKIRQRLEQRQDDKVRALPFFRKNDPWLRAAAIILVIAGSGWFAYRVFSPNEKGLALTPEPASPAASKPASADSATDQTVQLNRKQLTQKPAPQVPQPYNYNSRPTTLQQQPAQGTVTAAEHDQAAEAPSAVSREALEQKRVASNGNAQNRYAERFNNGGVDNRNVYARNQQQDRSRSFTPDPGNASNGGAVGRRQYNESAWNTTIDTQAMNKNIALQQNTSADTIRNFNVVLQSSGLPASEVIVLNPKEKAALPARVPHVIIDTLEPAEGWARFDDYIAGNLKTPEEIKTKQLAGEVQLSFDVDKNGQPTNITVVKSLCDQCDEEAVRLLKEGPKWKKKKDKKGKVTIRF